MVLPNYVIYVCTTKANNWISCSIKQHIIVLVLGNAMALGFFLPLSPSDTEPLYVRDATNSSQ